MKHAKKAFLASLLSTLLCVTMLIGTTFAWFTDSVTSGGNKILSGTLDIDLFQWTSATASTEITDVSDPIFGSFTSTVAQNVNANTLWEPGKTQIAYLSLKNNGNLWLKYTVKLTVTNVSKNLYEVMQYEILPDAKYGELTATKWTDLTGTPTSLTGTTIAAGATATVDTTAVGVPMGPGVEHFFALAIHMNEEAGNQYQAGEVDFDIQVLATQYTEEEDSFDDQYDLNADETPDNAGWPFLNMTAATESVTAGSPTTVGDLANEGVEATISADATNATELSLVVKEVTDSNSVITVAAGADSKYIDISLYDQDNNLITAFENNGYADVQIDIGENLIITEVNHKTTALTTDTTQEEYYSYDATTGILTLHVTSFSPFSIGFNAASYRIDDTYYAKFTSAMWAAAAGKTLYLLKDVTLNALQADKTFTIDLGGNTLTLKGHSVTEGGIKVYGEEGGNLTIMNGKLNFPGTGSSSARGIYNYAGKLTLTDVVIDSACDKAVATEPNVYAGNSKTTMTNVTINSTKASSTAVYVSAANNSWGMQSVPALEMTNVTVNAKYNAVASYACPVTVTDCTITAEGNNALWISNAAIASGVTNSVTVSGETTINAGSDYKRLNAQSGNTIVIKEGTYNFNPTSYVDAEAFDIAEANGTWTVTAK